MSNAPISFLQIPMDFFEDRRFKKIKIRYTHIGISIFLSLILILVKQKNRKILLADYEDLSIELSVELSTLQEIIENTGLFAKDDTYFWSEDLNEWLMALDTKRQKLSDAGKKSAELRKATTLQPSSNHLTTTFKQNSNLVEEPCNIILDNNILDNIREGKKILDNKNKSIKEKNNKKEKISDNEYLELLNKVIEYYNEIFKKNYKFNPNLLTNLKFWVGVHGRKDKDSEIDLELALESIKKAISGAYGNKFWQERVVKDKM
jgi:hypothetical protein